jgi:hypothetical protein
LLRHPTLNILVNQIWNHNQYWVFTRKRPIPSPPFLPFALASTASPPPPQLASLPARRTRPLSAHHPPPLPCSSPRLPLARRSSRSSPPPTAPPHYPQIHPREPHFRSTHAPPGPFRSAAGRLGGGSFGGRGRGDVLLEDGAPSVRRGPAGSGPAHGVVAAARKRGLLPRAAEERSPAAEAAARGQEPAPLALKGRQHLLPRQRLRLVRLIPSPYPRWILRPSPFNCSTPP